MSIAKCVDCSNFIKEHRNKDKEWRMFYRCAGIAKKEGLIPAEIIDKPMKCNLYVKK